MQIMNTNTSKARLIILLCSLSTALGGQTTTLPEQAHGLLFAKKHYRSEALPDFTEVRAKLPEPLLADNQEWEAMYWQAWKIAFRGLRRPAASSPLVSNWLDEAFSENIFQWDTIFMLMFARYGHRSFPFVHSLDNFYCRQLASGFIGREYRESDGRLIHFDFEGGLFSPHGYKNVINPPLFSWAEMESFRLTADSNRIALVFPVLQAYADWLDRPGDPHSESWEEQGRRSPNGLFWNTPLGSGMDNTPRPVATGAAWVEMGSQMVIMYRSLREMADILQDSVAADTYKQRSAELAALINRYHWHEQDAFYYDIDAQGKHFRKMTSGGFWPLLAGIADSSQANALLGHLQDSSKFWRPVPFPTLAADEVEYAADGGYWRGGVWAPTNVMIIKGLEQYGFYAEARQATTAYLAAINSVFLETGTFFENYAPEYPAPGNPARADFVGWTGCGPIQLLIENIIGIKTDAAGQRIIWKLTRSDKHGLRNLFLADNTIDLIYLPGQNDSDAAAIAVNCQAPFSLEIHANGEIIRYQIAQGKQRLTLEKGS
jgi:glycogen debranching enzyme